MKEKNTAPENMKRLLLMGAAAVIISFVAISVISKNGNKAKGAKANIRPVPKGRVQNIEATVV